MRINKQKEFDDRHTAGVSLLEASTNAVEDARPAKVAFWKENLAYVYKQQVEHRQNQLAAEKTYNTHF